MAIAIAIVISNSDEDRDRDRDRDLNFGDRGHALGRSSDTDKKQQRFFMAKSALKSFKNLKD